MHRPVGVFDSGLGGISVLREIHRLLPHEHLSYVADSAYAPYGDKSSEFIQERSLAVSRFLQAQGAKAIVVACNTATAHAVELLRAELSIPIVAIEPAVKPAVRLTKTGVIAVLATQRTTQSLRLKRLIETHAAQVQVLVQACPGLVEYVEQGDFGSAALRALLQGYIQPLLVQGADILVLGCTHYPFLTQTLLELSEHRVHVLEPSNAVAQQLQRILQQNQQAAPSSQSGQVQFYSSKRSQQHHLSMELLWQQPIALKPLPTP
ncbi:glutamate racemase [Thiolinea disciformis]|uniref:glutamate racemase n=1 Tax=Thiolinea disciformis TaxID=125614 RepID=UPI001FE1039E|nr:glutamate racemase [Thiolinea disciformis]